MDLIKLIEEKEIFKENINFINKNFITLIIGLIKNISEYLIKELAKEFNLEFSKLKKILNINFLKECFETQAAIGCKNGIYHINLCQGLIEFSFKLLRYFFLLFDIDINQGKIVKNESITYKSIYQTGIKIGSAYWKWNFFDIDVFPELEIDRNQLNLFIELFLLMISFFISHELGHMFIENLNQNFNRKVYINENDCIEFLKRFEESVAYKSQILEKWKKELYCDIFGYISCKKFFFKQGILTDLSIKLYFIFLIFCDVYLENRYDIKIRIDNWNRTPPGSLRLKNIMSFLNDKYDTNIYKIIKGLENSLYNIFNHE